MQADGALPGTVSMPGEMEESAVLLEVGNAGAVEMALKSGVAPPKRAGLQQWLAVDRQGRASLLELAKLRVTQRMGVQLRDLRLVDPHLAASYPSAILARERALVLNLEFIKCIVTMDAVYLTGLDEQLTMRFVSTLQQRLAAAANGASPEGKPRANESNAALPPRPPPGGEPSAVSTSRVLSLVADLPFELRVLEAALETVSRVLEEQAQELESAAHPALDALTAQVTTTALERVRRLKSRMGRLNMRVETLREVLEKFLNDDSDMKDLNLSARERERQEDELQWADDQPPGVGSLDLAVTPSLFMEDPATPAPAGTGPHDLVPDAPTNTTWDLRRGAGAAAPAGAAAVQSPAVQPRAGGSGRSERGSPRHTSSSSSSSESTLGSDEDVAVVEMLLEPYFMQLDNTYNKLQTLFNYIDDTEDFINIELDAKRNQIFKVNLVLASLNASIAFVTAFTGLFAMNLAMKPADEWTGQGPYSMFVIISVVAGLTAISLFTGMIVYAKRKRII